MFCCEICNVDLLCDEQDYVNVCPNCGLCYPYNTVTVVYRHCKSPPYRRVWHLSEILQTLPVSIPYNDAEKIQIMFKKYDREYTKNYPRKNFPNYKFIINYIAQHLQMDYINEQINVQGNPKTLKRWTQIWDSLDISKYAIYQ